MLLTTRAVRMLTRIAISSIVSIGFALHVAASPRFEIIDRMENYPYDVRGFTTISESLNARELTQMMNEFLTPNYTSHPGSPRHDR